MKNKLQPKTPATTAKPVPVVAATAKPRTLGQAVDMKLTISEPDLATLTKKALLKRLSPTEYLHNLIAGVA